MKKIIKSICLFISLFCAPTILLHAQVDNKLKADIISTGYVLPDWFTHGFMGLVNCICFAFVVIGVTWGLEKLHVKLKI